MHHTMCQTRSRFTTTLVRFAAVGAVATACGLATAALGCSSPPSRPPANGAASDAPTDEDGAARGPRSELGDAVLALFDDSAAHGRFSGVVLVADEGRVVAEKAYGVADPKTGRATTLDTIFRVGSMSKSFTASAILALAEEGKLTLDDPLSKHLPAYSRENLVRDGVEVTLRHLLTHTSGVPSFETSEGFPSAAWRRPITHDEVVSAGSKRPLATTPGTVYAYSNTGYALLAMVVEVVSGKGYESFLRERFFAPLGMNDTGVVLSDAQKARMASGVAFDGERPFVLADDPEFGDRDLTLAFGSGALFSTARDLFLWDRALADNADKRVLSAASIDALFTPAKNNYALGWVVRTERGETLTWHNGALSPLGFSSSWLRVPARSRLVVQLANLDREYVDQDIDEQVARIATGQPAAPRARVANEVLGRYVGTYTLSPTMALDVRRARGVLFLQATGQSRLVLTPVSETEFRVVGTSIRVSFPEGDGARAAELVLDQGGQKNTAKRAR